MTSSRDISLAHAEDANMMIAITAASVREVLNVSCMIPIFFLCGFLVVNAKRVCAAEACRILVGQKVNFENFENTVRRDRLVIIRHTAVKSTEDRKI